MSGAGIELSQTANTKESMDCCAAGSASTWPGEGGEDSDRLGHLKFQASCKHCSCCSCRMAGFTLDMLSVLTVARDLTAFWRASNNRDLQRSLSPLESACRSQTPVSCGQNSYSSLRNTCCRSADLQRPYNAVLSPCYAKQQ